MENRYEIHDLHATMLHLLGIEHTESTFRFGGRDMRLTEVYGHLIKEIWLNVTQSFSIKIWSNFTLKITVITSIRNILGCIDFVGA